MGCRESRDYTADIENLSQCQDLIRQIRDNQKLVMKRNPNHELFNNTCYASWATELQQLILTLRGSKFTGDTPYSVRKSHRQVTLSADELENLILWIDRVKYEMGKPDNKWLYDSDLAIIYTMKDRFINEVNKLKKELQEGQQE